MHSSMSTVRFFRNIYILNIVVLAYEHATSTTICIANRLMCDSLLAELHCSCNARSSSVECSIINFLQVFFFNVEFGIVWNMLKYCGFAQFSRRIGGTDACLVFCCVQFTAGCTYHKCMHWHSWLIHCTTSQKVAGSVPDGVVGIFP